MKPPPSVLVLVAFGRLVGFAHHGGERLGHGPVAVADDSREVGVKRVPVLVQPTRRVVRHFARVVRNGEGHLVPLIGYESRIFHLARELPRECAVRRLWKRALLVEQREDTHRLLLYEVQAELVILERHAADVDPFALVLFLLQLEQVPVELRLKPLVGVVDAQLFERVVLEELEAVDVEDAYRRLFLRSPV